MNYKYPVTLLGVPDHFTVARGTCFFVVIIGFNDNDNMMLVVKLGVVYVVEFAINER